MGRWIFLSAAAFLAYRYISRSNLKLKLLTGKPDPKSLPSPAPPPSPESQA